MLLLPTRTRLRNTKYLLLCLGDNIFYNLGLLLVLMFFYQMPERKDFFRSGVTEINWQHVLPYLAVVDTGSLEAPECGGKEALICVVFSSPRQRVSVSGGCDVPAPPAG